MDQCKSFSDDEPPLIHHQLSTSDTVLKILLEMQLLGNRNRNVIPFMNIFKLNEKTKTDFYYENISKNNFSKVRFNSWFGTD